MSTRRTSLKKGYVNTSLLPRGPNGRALCRRCGTEVPKGRRSWCGDGCVHDHRMESDPGYIRSQVRRRDNGVCAVCRLDCVRLSEALERAWRTGRSRFGRSTDRFKELWYWVTGRKPTPKFDGWRSLWEADHIVPVSEGGGECGLDNFRTLCIWCHNRVTAELKRRLAKKRKAV